MRLSPFLLLVACALESAPPATEPVDGLARSSGGASLVELRANAHVLDDEAWTAAIVDSADAAVACLGLAEHRVLHRYTRIPLLYADLSASDLQRVAACPTIARVGPDLEDFAAVDVVLDVIGAEAAWESAAADGAGVAVGVVDSGVRVEEPDLAGRVAFAYDHAEGDDDATDCSGHGSNVAAIAGAVAPGADLLIHKVFAIDRNNCASALHSHTARALDSLLAQRATHRLAVVNLSLAGSVRYAVACDDEIVGYTAGVRALYDAGVPVVASAGNHGDPSGASYPACLTTTIAVANSVKAPIDELVTDDIWRNSNGGPLIDLAAPGTRVLAGGSTRTGSSMSAPAVAGAVAVLASIDGAIGPEDARARLRVSPVEVVDARGSETFRFPRLDLPSVLDGARPVATPLLVDDGSDGSDGDGRAENGERVSVRFSAPGAGPWAGVTARLACADASATVVRGEVALGDVTFPVEGAAMTTGFVVATGPDCDEREVPCELALTDDRGLTRRFSLALPIVCQDDKDRDGFAVDVDCDDDDPLVYPGAQERCNGRDDDCDGVADNGLLEPWAPDADGDGFGALQTEQLCAAPAPHWRPVAERPADDCDDEDPLAYPGAPERCNGRDDDCDGAVDDGAGEPWWPDGDGDGDGFGAGEPVRACDRPAGHADRGGDCDDADAAVFPDDAGVCPQPGGCACDGAGAAPVGLAVLLVPLVLRRRRQRGSSRRAASAGRRSM